MADNMDIPTLITKIAKASKALDNNDLAESQRLVKEIESKVSELNKSPFSASIRANLGGVMIDLGHFKRDQDMVKHRHVILQLHHYDRP